MESYDYGKFGWIPEGKTKLNFGSQLITFLNKF
jgi:hypothetical protein